MKTSLELIEDGSRIFIDSNIFVYGSDRGSRRYDACKNLIGRIAAGRVSGLTSTAVLGEVFNAVSMNEISNRFRTADPEAYAKRNPEVLKALRNPHRVLDAILSIPNIEIASESIEIVSEAAKLALKAGLLITDAKIATTCNVHGVRYIATNDRDFERANLKVWAP